MINVLTFIQALFFPENVVCFLHLLHISKCTSDKKFSWKQIIWTLIRRLLREQSDLGPYCLQFRLPKNISRQEERTTSRDCQFFCFDSLHPSQQLFSHAGMGLPGLKQWIKCLAQGSSNPSFTSLTLYQLLWLAITVNIHLDLILGYDWPVAISMLWILLPVWFVSQLVYETH